MSDKQLPTIIRDQQTWMIRFNHFAAVSGTALPGPARVLVVDDYEPDRALAIYHLCEAWSFGRDVLVECASDGREALEKLRYNRFTVVVLDWNMPYLSGRDVLRTMRADGLCLPVVVVSAQQHVDIAHDLETMAAAFVHKNELNPVSFRSALTTSLQLPGVQWPGDTPANPTGNDAAGVNTPWHAPDSLSILEPLTSNKGNV